MFAAAQVEVAVYCPKCGRMLVAGADGVWRCASGGLALSRELGDRLAAEFAPYVKPGRERLRSGAWTCPACGVAVDGALACTECARSLAPHRVALIELHPHADGRGGFF